MMGSQGHSQDRGISRANSPPPLRSPPLLRPPANPAGSSPPPAPSAPPSPDPRDAGQCPPSSDRPTAAATQTEIASRIPEPPADTSASARPATPPAPAQPQPIRGQFAVRAYSRLPPVACPLITLR